MCMQRFSYGEAFGPWSAKSSPIRTLAEGAAVSATDGVGGGGFSSIAASRAHEKEFEGVSAAVTSARDHLGANAMHGAGRGGRGE
jgi:hypothetical protein|eukprot:COSAG01_NODE_303_length_19167_cov_10.792454_12_plen_85_part_00